MDMWEDAMEDFYEPEDSLADELMREELEGEFVQDAQRAADQAAEDAALKLFNADDVIDEFEDVDDWLDNEDDGDV